MQNNANTHTHMHSFRDVLIREELTITMVYHRAYTHSFTNSLIHSFSHPPIQSFTRIPSHACIFTSTNPCPPPSPHPGQLTHHENLRLRKAVLLHLFRPLAHMRSTVQDHCWAESTPLQVSQIYILSLKQVRERFC